MNQARTKWWRSLNWPNRISILRLMLVAPFVVLVMNQNKAGWSWARHAALGVFVVMALSDAADGILARTLDQRTRLGAILDPLADKALVFFAVILLSMPEFAVRGHRIDNWLVVCVVGKDLWVVIGFVVLYLVTDRFRSHATVFGKAATFGACILVPLVLLGPDFETLHPRLGERLVLGGEIVVAVLCVLAVISYTRVGLIFVHEQGKPLDGGPGTRTHGGDHGPDS
ncbi:MAG: CDP-alcohol phosphatidyltransferase family protein [Phycisphaerae bacterium]|nr:CDP-alcohol phosphatidyltransferase family protein [Phycisphaerae bacterium]